MPHNAAAQCELAHATHAAAQRALPAAKFSRTHSRSAPVALFVLTEPHQRPIPSRVEAKLRKTSRERTPAELLDYEIIQEQASALGRLGRALEEALRLLREFDATHAGAEARSPAQRQQRAALVDAAGYALWMFVV